ncbi:chromate transport protein [Treponema primitia ZAS-2]|uniref:Chromate transport protein n=1 Tax=Treponema primitia (strain ATCC BAA-887 / DSM 12427 / ZAS-2) TaxID=545694 RepID=F5YJM9_TREPZ|nr:chromate transporter [Treponema primitia]AEF86742.1 chromate transport protein [Treponema primitia ZAS-2]
MNEYFDLFVSFAKIGSITFGGGYAMLPIIERELVAKKGWVTIDEVMDYFAIGQVTPGIIAVNVSTFIGYKRKGIPGGILATLGMILPSLVIITIIAGFLKNFSDLPPVQHAFKGIRVAVGALILDAVIKLLKGAVKDWKSVAICVAAFALSAVLNASPVFLVIAAGFAGFLLYRPNRPPRPSAKDEKTP